ncbi:MAG: RdgB/HAM1 family non-canonical purine NTP pyrophosphatase [Patescibacteria group bacterium]|jgi:XTP/dITP diphosphohydrolase
MTIETIILATQNSGKVKEIKLLLAGLTIKILGAREAGVTDDVEEDAETLEANSLKKAAHVAKAAHQWAMADDSGLFIESLNNAPGIYSSRWAGPDFPREQLPDFLLHKMANIPIEKRNAYWECGLVLVSPAGGHWTFNGRVSGHVATEQHGQPRPNMPYDTIFVPEGETRTMAEMTEREKNAISHRGRAIAKMKEFITKEQAQT